MSGSHLATFYEGLAARLPCMITFSTPFGPCYLCAGLPAYSCAEFTVQITGSSLCCYLHCIFIISICSHISCCSFSCLQGGCAFASKVAQLRDPKHRKLPVGLTLRAAKTKSPSTTERYSRAFQKFREWSSCLEEVACLPSDEMSVALYLEFLLQRSYHYSTLQSACYGISWVHNFSVYSFPSPCDSKLVRNVLQAAKR